MDAELTKAYIDEDVSHRIDMLTAENVVGDINPAVPRFVYDEPKMTCAQRNYIRSCELRIYGYFITEYLEIRLNKVLVIKHDTGKEDFIHEFQDIPSEFQDGLKADVVFRFNQFDIDHNLSETTIERSEP